MFGRMLNAMTCCYFINKKWDNQKNKRRRGLLFTSWKSADLEVKIVASISRRDIRINYEDQLICFHWAVSVVSDATVQPPTGGTKQVIMGQWCKSNDNLSSLTCHLVVCSIAVLQSNISWYPILKSVQSHTPYHDSYRNNVLSSVSSFQQKENILFFGRVWR